MFAPFNQLYNLFNKLVSQIAVYIDNHAATKERPKLFQATVLLIVVFISTFLLSRIIGSAFNK